MFDEDPQEYYESYPCDDCGGNITFNDEYGVWECDTCDFFSAPTEGNSQ